MLSRNFRREIDQLTEQNGEAVALLKQYADYEKHLLEEILQLKDTNKRLQNLLDKYIKDLARGQVEFETFKKLLGNKLVSP